MSCKHLLKRTCYPRIRSMFRHIFRVIWISTAVCLTIGVFLLLNPDQQNDNLEFEEKWTKQWTENHQYQLNTASRNKDNFTIYKDHPPETENDFMETCTPITRVVFLKVHKTGSSTVANILQRFGITRELNFAVPWKRPHQYGYNYIGQPGHTIEENSLMPLPEGESYDILWNHVVYNRTAFRKFMPSDTVYISIIREPFEQFVSAFEYYKMFNIKYIKEIMDANLTNPISTYLQNYSILEPPGRQMSHIRNKMVADLGMTLQQLNDKDQRMSFIHDLDEDFKLIMIMEYFDESLVLLKRTLCWNHKDILYFSQNINPFRPRRVYDTLDRQRHQFLSNADYELYDYFYKKFGAKLAQQKNDFFEEVRHFRHILRSVMDHCLMRKPLSVPSSQWSGEFVVTLSDCRMMRTSELAFLDKILSVTSEKYNRHNYNIFKMSQE